MFEFRGKVDRNDLDHVLRLGTRPVVAEPCPIGDGGKINPHVTRFYREDGGFTSVFHVKPVYYENHTGEWRPMSEVTSHHGNKLITFNEKWTEVHPRYMIWLIRRAELIGGRISIDVGRSAPVHIGPENYMAATLTAHPDPDPETTTADGNPGEETRAAWATIRGDAGDALDLSGTGTIRIDLYSGFTTNEWERIYRGIAGFDTSAIGSGTVDDATYSFVIFLNGANDELGYNPVYNVVSSSPASNTNIVAGDYDSLGSTSFGATGVHSSLTEDGSTYTDVTLNASGESHINTSGVTNFGLLDGNDFSNSEPTWSSDEATSIAVMSSDTTGTDKDPKLVVNYTPGATAALPIPNLALLGAG